MATSDTVIDEPPPPTKRPRVDLDPEYVGITPSPSPRTVTPPSLEPEYVGIGEDTQPGPTMAPTGQVTGAPTGAFPAAAKPLTKDTAIAEPQKAKALTKDAPISEPQKPKALTTDTPITEPKAQGTKDTPIPEPEKPAPLPGAPEQSDQVVQAQERLRQLVDSGASDQEIQQARQVLQAAQIPQAAGGKPTPEQLANLPYTPPQQPAAVPEQAPGGVPTAEQLANLPSAQLPAPGIVYSPEQMAQKQADIERQADEQTLAIARSARPNLEPQAYGASAAAAAGVPIFAAPKPGELEAEKQAEEDKRWELPEAVTARSPVTAAPLKLTLGGQPQDILQAGEGDQIYSEQDRAQALINKFGHSAEALEEAASRNSPEYSDDFNRAILQVLKENKERPFEAGAESVWHGFGNAWNFIAAHVGAINQLPGLVKGGVDLAKAMNAATDAYEKKLAGQPLTPEDKANLLTLSAAIQSGFEHGGSQFSEDVAMALTRLNNDITNKEGRGRDMNYDQIQDLSPDKQKEAINDRIAFLRGRHADDINMQEGRLKPFYAKAYQAAIGEAPPTLEDLAKSGVHIPTDAIGVGGMLFDPRNIGFALAGPLGIDEALTQTMSLGGRVIGRAMGIASKVGEKIEPAFPVIGRKIGEQTAKAVEHAVVSTLTGGATAPIPSWLYPGGKWNIPVRIGGKLGELTGSLPEMFRKNIFNPVKEAVTETSEALRTGTKIPTLMRIPAAAVKGELYATPYMVGPKTAEERGEIGGAGAIFGGAHVAPEVARDLYFSGLFDRGPGYKSLNAPAFQYGTDHWGLNFDNPHDTWIANQHPEIQSQINDFRALTRPSNTEIYGMGNNDFQQTTADLQAKGALPAGNLRTRGFNILKDPATGQTLMLINGEHPDMAVLGHEFGHSIYRELDPQTQAIFKNAALQFNDPERLSSWYFNNIGRPGVTYSQLPSEAGIANGSQSFLNGLQGYTREHFIEEMGAETVAALLKGQPLYKFTRDASLFRKLQLATGTVLNKMGIDVTPAEAQTILGVKPSVAQMAILDKALRDHFKRNAPTIPTRPPKGGGGGPGPKPGPKGRPTAAPPPPKPQPAPKPTPSPVGGPVVNNQPNIGGGPTGAPPNEINDAVSGLQSLGYGKRQAQQMVASANGQSAAELMRSALRNYQTAQGRVEVPRTPQEAQAQQAPPMPHPLEPYRKMATSALGQLAIYGDQQGVQALIERHGANWLQHVEKEDPEVAAEYRRKYPEQAAEQDQRIKAGVEGKPDVQAQVQELLAKYKRGEISAQDFAEQSKKLTGKKMSVEWKPGTGELVSEEDKALRQKAIDAAEKRPDRASFMPMAGEKAVGYPDQEAGGKVFISPIHGAKQFEIDDRDMEWTPAPPGAAEKTMLDYNWGHSADGSSRLGEVITHPNLFKNYPDMQFVRVEMNPNMRGEGSWEPRQPDQNGVMQRERITLRSFNKPTLAHEIQHAVQFRENWPLGSSPMKMVLEMNRDQGITDDLAAIFNIHHPELGPSEFPSQQDYFDYIADRDDQWQQWYRQKLGVMAMGAYKLVPGEVEATAVKERAAMPPGWRVKPEESLAEVARRRTAEAQQQYAQAFAPPQQIGFMPESPEAEGERLANEAGRMYRAHRYEDKHTPEEVAQAYDRAFAAGGISAESYGRIMFHLGLQGRQPPAVRPQPEPVPEYVRRVTEAGYGGYVNDPVPEHPTGEIGERYPLFLRWSNGDPRVSRDVVARSYDAAFRSQEIDKNTHDSFMRELGLPGREPGGPVPKSIEAELAAQQESLSRTQRNTLDQTNRDLAARLRGQPAAAPAQPVFDLRGFMEARIGRFLGGDPTVSRDSLIREYQRAYAYGDLPLTDFQEARRRLGVTQAEMPILSEEEAANLPPTPLATSVPAVATRSNQHLANEARDQLQRWTAGLSTRLDVTRAYDEAFRQNAIPLSEFDQAMDGIELRGREPGGLIEPAAAPTAARPQIPSAHRQLLHEFDRLTQEYDDGLISGNQFYNQREQIEAQAREHAWDDLRGPNNPAQEALRDRWRNAEISSLEYLRQHHELAGAAMGEAVPRAVPTRAKPAQPPLPAKMKMLHQLWRSIGDDPGTFKYNQMGPQEDIHELAKQISSPGNEITAEEIGNTIKLKSKQGNIEIESANTDTPSIYAMGAGSEGKGGGGGAQLYALAFKWAHNNEKTIKSYSLTDINQLRRTSNMFSSALREGSTDHLSPATSQRLDWRPGEDEHNLAELARRESELSQQRIPSLKNLGYDFLKHEFYDRQSGNPITDQDILAAIKRDDPHFGQGVGLTTAKRALITDSAMGLHEALPREGTITKPPPEVTHEIAYMPEGPELGAEREGEGPEEPQIPGSRVSFMPDIPAAPAALGKKPKKPPIIRYPQEMRDARMSPEEKAKLADIQAKAEAGLPQYPDPGISGNKYASGQQPFPEGKMTKAQVGAFFDAQNPRLDFTNPEHQQLMAQALTHDVLQRLISDPESLGWYNRNVDWAMQELGQLDPRITQDPVRNLMMRLAMAITSQNQKVHPNFESAYRAYLYWDRTGKLPEDASYFGGGTKAGAMIANFKKINELIHGSEEQEALGHDGLEDVLKTPMTVRQIKDNFKVKIFGEAQDYKSEASMLMGPKIGSFFNNLSKLYHTLTADLWFSRTMNRMAGHMMGFTRKALIGSEEPDIEGDEEEAAPDEVEVGKHQLGKLRDLINSGQLENATKAQQRAMLKEIDALEAYRDNPEDLDRDQAMALSPTIRDWAAKQHKIYADSTGFTKDGKPLQTYGEKTPSNLVSKNIDLNFQKLSDAPRNSTERQAFRDIMQIVQDNLKGLGIDIEHADNQAVIWYLEQDLFARAKGRKAGSNSADYLDAAYALRQKYQGQTPDEFGKVPDLEAPPEAPKLKRPRKAAAMPEGPAFPSVRGPPLPRMFVPSLASQAASDESKRQTGMPSAFTTPARPQVQPGQTTPQPQPPAPPISAPSPSVPQPQQQPPSFKNPNGTEFPERIQAVGGQDPKAFITHHTGGRGTVQGVVDTLRERGLGVEYVMDRDGNIFKIGEAGAQNIQPGWGAGAGLNNRNIVGMEVIARDNNDVTQAQKDSFARFMAMRYPNTPIFGHGEVNPGHKEADEGKATKDAAMAFRQGRGGAPDQEARVRTALRSAGQIMREEGPSDVQDGRREVFGFREGQDSEYPELARLRASGDEQGVQRLAVQGLLKRAVEAGSGQFNDPAVKAQIMSLAHMRGPGGARAILNAVGGGRRLAGESETNLDPAAVARINQAPREAVMREIERARTAYDQRFLGDLWNRFGKGLAGRYAREHEFYTNLQ